VTSLGIPTLRPPSRLPTWIGAWDRALYGEQGFFRTHSPADHFRTSVHASPLFAQALARMTREAGLDTVVDVGAGRGELLVALHALDPGLDLLGVEVAPRPAELPGAVAWTAALPEAVDGVVVANEWLDNVPCSVVEVDPAGVLRVVHVDQATGTEELGLPVDHQQVPSYVRDWLERWWPLDGAEPGTRAEVGASRDQAWRSVVDRVTHGLAVAVDYGHTRETRPPFGSMRSYRDGREVDVLPDGSRDVTAHVAVDAVAAAVGAHVRRQRDVLPDLGVSAERPPLGLATTDPPAYVRALSRATEATELTAVGGLGDFWWVVTEIG
jgi:SAM-dependent MidA family methyltransferase